MFAGVGVIAALLVVGLIVVSASLAKEQQARRDADGICLALFECFDFRVPSRCEDCANEEKHASGCLSYQMGGVYTREKNVRVRCCQYPDQHRAYTAADVFADIASNDSRQFDEQKESKPS
jgi:hypothetical protein